MSTFRRSISGAGLISSRAGRVDRVDGGLERVQALQQHVDGGALEAAAPLAQKLEDVLHLVREGRHAGEAHGRAHPLHGVRDAKDLVDRLAVVGRLLDPDHREVELLQVLTSLGQEHREVLGYVVHVRCIGRGRDLSSVKASKRRPIPRTVMMCVGSPSLRRSASTCMSSVFGEPYHSPHSAAISCWRVTVLPALATRCSSRSYSRGLSWSSRPA